MDLLSDGSSNEVAFTSNTGVPTEVQFNVAAGGVTLVAVLRRVQTLRG